MKRLMNNSKYIEQKNVYVDYDDLKKISQSFGIDNLRIDIEGDFITFRNKQDNSVWLEMKNENGKWFRV